MVYIAVHFC